MKDKNEHAVLEFPRKKQKRVILKEPNSKSLQLKFTVEIKSEE